MPWLACDVDDLDRFPGSHVCEQQILHCAKHRERLRCLRSVHGWQGGFWDNCLDDLAFSRRYWLALSTAHDSWYIDTSTRRKRLLVLKELIGPERYRDGWRPVLIPDVEKFGEKPPMRRADKP